MSIEIPPDGGGDNEIKRNEKRAARRVLSPEEIERAERVFVELEQKEKANQLAREILGGVSASDVYAFVNKPSLLTNKQKGEITEELRSNSKLREFYDHLLRKRTPSKKTPLSLDVIENTDKKFDDDAGAQGGSSGGLV